MVGSTQKQKTKTKTEEHVYEGKGKGSVEADRLVESEITRLSSSYLCSETGGGEDTTGGAQLEKALLVCVCECVFLCGASCFFVFVLYLHKTKPLSDRRSQVEHALTSFQAKP